MRKRGFLNTGLRFGRKVPVIAAAFALALVMGLTGCDTGNGTVAVERFTVTFAANQGSGTAPAARTVDAGTSIVLPGQGNLSRTGYGFAGWNTQANGQGTNHAEGSDFMVNATVTLFARWVAVEPVTLSITGLPTDAGWVEMSLRNLAGSEVAWGEEQQSSGTVEFELNIIPGAYNIHLSFWDGSQERHYRTANTVQLVSGDNTVAFTQFTEIVPITITVTNVPDAAVEARIELLNQAGNRVAGGWSWIGSATSANFTLRDSNDNLFTTPGTYEIRLVLFGDDDDDGWHTIGAYRIASRNITAGNNSIAFNLFQEMPPITVTITGVPANFQGYWGMLALTRPGEDLSEDSMVGESNEVLMGATTVFTVHGATPGTFDVLLALIDAETDDIVGIRTASSRNIAATGTSIPWGNFTDMPLSRVTVTGIPADYEGVYAGISVGNLMNEEFTAGGGARVVDGSFTTILFDFQTYWLLERTVSGQVVVFLEREIELPGGGWDWELNVYARLDSVTFPAGQTTTIQWSSLINVSDMLGFSADQEPASRSRAGVPVVPGARSRLLRAR